MKNRSRTQISWHPLHPLSIALSMALCRGNLTTVLRTRLCSIFLCQQQFIIIAVITIFIITIDEDYNMEHSWSASPSDNVAQTTSFWWKPSFMPGGSSSHIWVPNVLKDFTVRAVPLSILMIVYLAAISANSVGILKSTRKISDESWNMNEKP